MAVPSAIVAATLEKNYKGLIEEAFEKVLGKKVTVDFSVKEFEEPIASQDSDFFKPIQSSQPVLNPKFTLENFVVGPSNNLAFAAAEAIVQNPGTSYNPLFLYGGTGVGKTHLMLGIGNALLKLKPHLKVIYCSSDKFMNDYVEAIQNHRMGDLRKKYRALDILLIDDIQFFSGREGTQEEFFHTFNELQGKNAQMVITSDRPPADIEKLEDRLRSRFAGGLMVDIQAPDFDTRMAILKAKCKERGVILDEDALRLLASSISPSIRELEGKLMQIIQSLKLQNLPPTAANITPFLNLNPKPLTLTPKEVLASICEFFNLSLKDLTGPKRQKELVLPRHIAMYILSEETKMTVEGIGQLLGNRDHTTVMHGRDKIKALALKDLELQKILTDLQSSFR